MSRIRKADPTCIGVGAVKPCCLKLCNSPSDTPGKSSNRSTGSGMFASGSPPGVENRKINTWTFCKRFATWS